MDIFQRLFQLKGLQNATERDPLLELAEIGSFEFTIQFGLAGQQDLEHFAAAVFQVAEQPDFLEHLPIQVVRLIHDEYGSTSQVGALYDHLVQGEKHLGLGRPGASQAEVVGDHFEELLDVQSGIEQ